MVDRITPIPPYWAKKKPRQPKAKKTPPDASGGAPQPVKRRKPVKHEDIAQRQLVTFLRDLEKKTGVLTFFCVPNQLAVSEALRIAMWRLGLRAGVPDLILVFMRKIVFVEIKIKNSSSLSPDQEAFQSRLSWYGHDVHTITATDGVDLINQVCALLPRYCSLPKGFV